MRCPCWRNRQKSHVASALPNRHQTEELLKTRPRVGRDRRYHLGPIRRAVHIYTGASVRAYARLHSVSLRRVVIKLRVGMRAPRLTICFDVLLVTEVEG